METLELEVGQGEVCSFVPVSVLAFEVRSGSQSPLPVEYMQILGNKCQS